MTLTKEEARKNQFRVLIVPRTGEIFYVDRPLKASVRVLRPCQTAQPCDLQAGDYLLRIKPEDQW